MGETEKNLSEVFDRAESFNGVLFSDEADALLGERKQVSGSNDRNTNIDTGFLLQRMEEFAGIAILASNLRQKLDRAFVRRMRFIVEFPFPAKSRRKRPWGMVWRWFRRIPGKS